MGKHETKQSMPRASNAERIDGFDNLRAFAMILVVFMHSISSAMRAEELDGLWFGFTFIEAVGFTAVPCFFMMSGALLLGGKGAKTPGEFYRRRLPRVLAPLLFWSVLTLWSDLNFQDTQALVKQLCSILRTPANVALWFLYTLIPLYLLTPFLKPMVDALTSSGQRWLIALIAVVNLWYTLCFIMPQRFAPYFGVDAFTQLFFLQGYLGFFLLGALFRIRSRTYPSKYLWLMVVVMIAFNACTTWFASRRAGYYISAFHGQNLFFSGVLAVCEFLLFLQSPPARQGSRLHSLVRWLVQMSFGMYVSHALVLKILHESNYPMRTWSSSMIGFVLTFSICLGAIFLLSSIKPLCFLATGLRWEEACHSCNLQWLFSRLRKK